MIAIIDYDAGNIKSVEKAMQLLESNQEQLHRLAEYLYTKETITGEEFMQILNAPVGGTQTVE